MIKASKSNKICWSLLYTLARWILTNLPISLVLQADPVLVRKAGKTIIISLTTESLNYCFGKSVNKCTCRHTCMHTCIFCRRFVAAVDHTMTYYSAVQAVDVGHTDMDEFQVDTTIHGPRMKPVLGGCPRQQTCTELQCINAQQLQHRGFLQNFIEAEKKRPSLSAHFLCMIKSMMYCILSPGPYRFTI